MQLIGYFPNVVLFFNEHIGHAVSCEVVSPDPFTLLTREFDSNLMIQT